MLRFIIVFIFVFTFVFCEDFYGLLGISKDATTSEIRKGFKKLALIHHPDKNKDDEGAHDRFLKITKAYEVLKDEELRKKYDMYGEAGLKDDHFANQYQSYDYYSNQFGIYDDDPEIIVLSQSDFEQSVIGSDDMWFIKFYSPYCTHCHTVAPIWREIAKQFDGALRIGAVSCQDDYALCRNEGIPSYPSFKLYPRNIFYYDSQTAEKMSAFILKNLDSEVVKITSKNIKAKQENGLPWIVSFCSPNEDCLYEESGLKLAAMLEKLVSVGTVNCKKNKKLCSRLGHTSEVVYYKEGVIEADKGTVIHSLSAKEILHEVLMLLPEPFEITPENYMEVMGTITVDTKEPVLIAFFKGEKDKSDVEIRKLTALIPNAKIAIMNCQITVELCSRYQVSRYPSVVLQKYDGYEWHHGRYTAHDIAVFTRESSTSNVRTLSGHDFPHVTQSGENWYIDFFAPWCPPCMKLLPEWRKAGRQIGGRLAKFGTVDCTTNHHICQQNNIRSYPTTVFYNNSVPHFFTGFHTAEQLINFVEDTLDPPVENLTPETFESEVNHKEIGVTFIVDFYAPWCGPCMELAPTMRQLAKRLGDNARVAQVDCQQFHYFCQMQNVNSYPTIRLYPYNSHGAGNYVRQNGWRDLESLHQWVYQHFPSVVQDLDESTFYSDVIQSEAAWIVDFYAPWCGPCIHFAPVYDQIASRLDGRIIAGKVNCENHHQMCRNLGVTAYPTVRFYGGALQDGMSQPISGVKIKERDAESFIRIAEGLLEKHIHEKEDYHENEDHRPRDEF